MRKFFAILFLIFGVSFVALPFVPMGCNDVSASADTLAVAPPAEENYTPTLELYRDPYGITIPLTLSGSVSPSPDIMSVPFFNDATININNSGEMVIRLSRFGLNDRGLVRPLSSTVDIVIDMSNTTHYLVEDVEYNSSQSINGSVSSIPFWFIYEWITDFRNTTVPHPILFYESSNGTVHSISRVVCDYYQNSMLLYIDLPAFNDGAFVQSANSRITLQIESPSQYPYWFPLGMVGDSPGLIYTKTLALVAPSPNLMYDTIYQDGYDEGYKIGEDVGYRRGINEDLNSITPWQMLVQQIDTFFNIPLFGSEITFGTILSIGFGMILFGIAIKVFLGG